jgi:UDP-N-acetylglucosamine 1-carboxyvinyltransferase
MAAALTPGVTSLTGAAREPEVVALSRMLVEMGAEIEGIGESNLFIHGQEYLRGVQTHLIGDRLEAMTYLLAGLVSGGRVRATGIDPEYLGAPLEVLHSMGATVATGPNYVELQASGELKAATIITGPYPQFATDIQPLFAPLFCMAHGVSEIDELVFEGRFGYMSELCRLGARVQVDRQRAYINGPCKLSGAPVECLDIRAAAALVIAGVAASGVTKITEIQHLRRGYDQLEGKLRHLGVNLKRRIADPEDFLFVGC